MTILNFLADGQVLMWLTFAIIFAAVVLFAVDKLALEITGLLSVTALLLLFTLAEEAGAQKSLLLTAQELLQGFANPVLFTILALLVIGQGLFQTGAVDKPARMIARLGRAGPTIALGSTLLVAGALSAFLNNTPVVVIFIPIIAAISASIGQSQSRTLMPLSFISILGGMTTLIGSSSNLIVAALALESGQPKIGFFDFVVPGSLLAAIGALYVIFVLPRLLPETSSGQSTSSQSGRLFIVEEKLQEGNPWCGAKAQLGLFPVLKDITVRMIRRGNRNIARPFDDIAMQAGDVVSVAATRKTLTEALTANDSRLLEPPTVDEIAGLQSDLTQEIGEAPLDTHVPGRSEMLMAEAMVPPASRLIGLNIAQAARNPAITTRLLGIQRRQRMVRQPLDQIRIEAGDVVLLYGAPDQFAQMRNNRDLMVIESSTSDLPTAHHANRALIIFALTILAAATRTVPIVVASLAGALAMILLGCLNVRQATRAIDGRIVVLIGAAFALAAALKTTGGADTLAAIVVTAFSDFGPAVLLSAMFLLTAILTNFLSNQATAALMTPVAISAALQIGADPLPFVYGLIFALNCSFGTPIAYQTNLIVMAPGGYTFMDYVRGGFPLIILLWIAYSLFAPIYFNL